MGSSRYCERASHPIPSLLCSRALPVSERSERAAAPLEFKFLFLGRKRKEPSPNSFLIDPAYAPLPPAWRDVGKHWRVISDEPWPDDRQTTTAPRICFVSLREFDPLRRALKRRVETIWPCTQHGRRGGRRGDAPSSRVILRNISCLLRTLQRTKQKPRNR